MRFSSSALRRSSDFLWWTDFHFATHFVAHAMLPGWPTVAWGVPFVDTFEPFAAGSSSLPVDSAELGTTHGALARRSRPHFGRTTPCSIIVRPVEITVSAIGRMVQPSSFCAFAELTSSFRPT